MLHLNLTEVGNEGVKNTHFKLSYMQIDHYGRRSTQLSIVWHGKVVKYSRKSMQT